MYAGANNGPQHPGGERGNLFGQQQQQQHHHHHQFQHQFQQQQPQGGQGFGPSAYSGPGQYNGNLQDMDGKKK